MNEITLAQIKSMADHGLSIKHIHKMINKYKYTPLREIRRILISGDYSPNKNRTWSKEK